MTLCSTESPSFYMGSDSECTDSEVFEVPQDPQRVVSIDQ